MGRLCTDELKAIREFHKNKNYNVYSVENEADSDDCLFSVEAYTVQGMLAQLPLLFNQVAALKDDNLKDIEDNTVTLEHEYVGDDRWLVGAFVWNEDNQAGQLIECIVVQED